MLLLRQTCRLRFFLFMAQLFHSPLTEQRVKDQAINELFALHTDQDKKKIENDTERDFFMTGQEALEYGIVDKVITKREMVSMGKNSKNKNICDVDKERDRSFGGQ